MIRDWLIEKRVSKNLSQTYYIVSSCGITQQAYSCFERGIRRPRFETAIKLGNILDFEWTLFYEGKNKDEGKENCNEQPASI